jgi:hypothetical protein
MANARGSIRSSNSGRPPLAGWPEACGFFNYARTVLVDVAVVVVVDLDSNQMG